MRKRQLEEGVVCLEMVTYLHVEYLDGLGHVSFRTAMAWLKEGRSSCWWVLDGANTNTRPTTGFRINKNGPLETPDYSAMNIQFLLKSLTLSELTISTASGSPMSVILL